MQDITNILSDLTEIDGQPMTTSRLVAKRFKKLHKNVLQAIKRIEAQQPEFSRLNFQPAEFTDSRGKTQTEYRMTRDGFSLLAMGFTGDEALEWKIGYIKAFNRMADEIAKASRVPAVPVTLHERIVAWEQLDSATYSAAKSGSADMNKRKRALKVLRPEAALIAQERQPDMFAIEGDA